MKQTIEIPEGFELKKVSDTEYKIVKKGSELPNTWEEFCEKYPVKNKEYYIGHLCDIGSVPPGERRPYADQNLLPNKEYAEAILALCQLIQLRDCYRQGWKPSGVNKNELGYCIGFDLSGPVETIVSGIYQLFSFQSKEIRDKFLNNFSELLKKVAYLYSN